MNRTLELPATVYAELERAAAASGTTPAEWIEERLPKCTATETNRNGLHEEATVFDQFLDLEFLAECAREADSSITPESIRQALAKIPGSMTEDFIAEREER